MMDAQISAPEYVRLFHGIPALLLALSPNASFTIIDATDAYLDATRTKRTDIIGYGLFEVFPYNPTDPSAADARCLGASLGRVMATRQADAMPTQKYHIPRPPQEGGGFDERYWSPHNWPLFDDSGNLVCIIHKVKDVTEQVLADRAKLEAEEEQHRVELRYRSLVEHMPAIAFTVVAAPPYQPLFVSPQLRRLGLDPLVFQANPDIFWNYVHPSDIGGLRRAWEAFLDQRDSFDHEYRFIMDNGDVRWLRGQAVIVHENNDGFIQAILTDVTERKRVELELRTHRDHLEELVAERTEALQLANHRLADDIHRRQQVERALFAEKQRIQITLRSIADAVVAIDANGLVEFLNPAAESLLGCSEAEAAGHPLIEALPLTPMAMGEGSLLERLSTGAVSQGDYRLPRAGGDDMILALSSTALHGDNDLPAGAVIVFRDVTEERLRTASLTHRARHDPLTGLANRAEFERRLRYTLESMEKTQEAHHVLLFIDLDGFKLVNDNGGHAAGDEMLRQLSKSIAGQIRQRDTLARMGGDEFACLFEHCDLQQGLGIAQAISSAVRDFKLIWEGKIYSVGVSIGVVPLHKGGKPSVESVLQEADAACYEAKAAGHNAIRVRRPEAGPPAPQPEARVGLLRRALAEDFFTLAAQPIEHLASATVQGYEVLLRLQEQNEVIPAEAFMPSAERHKLAGDIDHWVIRHVLMALSERDAAGIDTSSVYYISLSPAALADGKLIDFIQEQLRAYPITAEHIGFDIPESVLLKHFREVREFTCLAKSLGCRVALDEFDEALPVAHSLKDLGLDLVKISARLTAQVGEDAVSCAMVDAMNRVVHAMGGSTVAKCPDTSETTLAKIRTLGIDLVQGNLVEKPLLQLH
jgi:diguanylate cyclase (GGDEF)-like protein/PAS domain S-box-containing protein